MSLVPEDTPPFISPPSRCTPSRFAGEKVLSRIVRNIALKSNVCDVLDVGCGSGEYRFLFPGCDYTGIDITDHKFREKSDDHHSLLVADADRLPLAEDSQDIVFSFCAFEYFERPGAALAEIARVLRPGGTALLCVPTKWVKIYDMMCGWLRHCGANIGYASASDGIRHYSPDRLQNLARENGLSVQKTISVYGAHVYSAKIATSLYRTSRHAWSRLWRKMVHGSSAGAFPLYVERDVGLAKTGDEWQDILRKEEREKTLRNRLYVLWLKIASTLDEALPTVPTVEFVQVLGKSTRTGE